MINKLLQWTIIIPILAWGLFFSGVIHDSGLFQIMASVLLIFSVMAAVHYSEIIAHRVGEPYGTIILAVSITVIEVFVSCRLDIIGRCPPTNGILVVICLGGQFRGGNECAVGRTYRERCRQIDFFPEVITWTRQSCRAVNV